MTTYSMHFIVGLSLAMMATLALLYSRKKLWPFLAVPVIYFVLFYNYDYSLLPGVAPLLICYAGAIFCCFWVLLTASAKKGDVVWNGCNGCCIKIFLLVLTQLVCIFVCLCFPWAIDTFPLSNADTVLFTVFAGENEGAEEFVVSSFFKRVPFYAIGAFAVVFVAQLAFACYLIKRKISIIFNLWKIRYGIAVGDFKAVLLQIAKPVTLMIFSYMFILSVLLPGIFLSSAFEALTQKPVDSELYKTQYVHPDSVKITSPEQPKNLIVIFLESMETNFAKYTPEIASLEKANTNFPPGGVSVAGTSWTIAGLTSKMCGIPLNMPMGVDQYLGRLPTYLPNAKCLMDILADNGYNQLYSQGSSGDFTQKRFFWNVHGNVELHDLEYYKKIGKIPSDYFAFWGFEDRKLYGFVKEDLDSLSKIDKPFALYMLTVDTHQPEGYVDSLCAIALDEALETLPKALHCASRQLYEFIEWAQKQPWFDNTVISVMGDHTMQMLSTKAHVPFGDSLYWTNFIVNSSVKTPVQERPYTSLDMFPTILEAMDFKIEGRGLGLGKSLYSDSHTVLEIYGRKTLDSLLRERSYQYDYFLFGKK